MLDVLRTDARARPIVLSGGLNAQNIGQAIHTVRPWAVDVSSGVETAAGIKSSDKIHALRRAITIADDAYIAKPNE
jgi:phosphoribosylanthranilate isomerase